MNALPTFEFASYRMRPATMDDLPTARAWNAADPDHEWEMQFERFWVEQTLVANSYVLEDAEGPVFFLKMVRGVHSYADSQGKNRKWEWDTQVELQLQFNPAPDRMVKLRTMEGLVYGWPWLERMLAGAGADTVYFQSKNPRTIQFATKRLGFSGDVYGGSDRYQACIAKAA